MTNDYNTSDDATVTVRRSHGTPGGPMDGVPVTEVIIGGKTIGALIYTDADGKWKGGLIGQDRIVTVTHWEGEAVDAIVMAHRTREIMTGRA